MNMKYLPDTEIKQANDDALGLNEFVALVAASIEATETPFVYGILGDWGTGKTSVMRLLHNKLGDKNSAFTSQCFVPIWFNAWLYENEENMIYPLLQAIRVEHKKFDASIERGAFEEVFRVVATTSLAVCDIGLRAITKRVVGEAYKIDDVTKQAEMIDNGLASIDSVFADWTDRVGKLQSAFADLIEQFAADYAKATGTATENVVFLFLIDDLDRCLPDATLAVIEGIKNFLTVPHCVYVLGLNPGVVYAAIKHRFLGVDVNGREYLEKIINFAFYVPEPTQSSLREFAVKQLTALLPDARTQDLKTHLDTFGNVISDCGFSNPRKIKRILNRYLMFLSHNQKQLAEFDMSNIVRLIVMSEYYPDIFQLFLSKPDSPLVEMARNIPENDFDLQKFELLSGLSIKSDLAHLKRIGKLFQLAKPSAEKASLTKHTLAVFAIARLR